MTDGYPSQQPSVIKEIDVLIKIRKHLRLEKFTPIVSRRDRLRRRIKKLFSSLKIDLL